MSPWMISVLVIVTFITGYQIGSRMCGQYDLWTLRLHFYSKGMSHTGVDKNVDEIMEQRHDHPRGLGALERYRFIQSIIARRKKEGLKS